MTQLMVILMFTLIPILVYVAAVGPFEKSKDVFINIFNEAVIVFTFVSVIVMNAYELPEFLINLWGWFLIILVVFSLVATWVISLPGVIKSLIKDFKNLFIKKKLKKKPKEKERTVVKVERNDTSHSQYIKPSLKTEEVKMP
eukprot:TRINITY_DN7174_c0_g1_i6.p1 TRINITY_DN7174_c0_g1~~TRINITY_DN7174_c0_g1_i6.p1  ORF type:complete len:142 (-),score=18.66 TRINITY_DN7174_c0_g1_i6:86-511(-)